MALPETLAVIQASLAPTFLVTGAAVFLQFTQARLFRVVDRTRATPVEGPPRASLLRRARLLRNAIVFGVLSIAFTVVTGITLMLSVFFEADALAGAAPISFGAAMVALSVALGFTLRDTVLSVRSVEGR